MHTRVTDIHTVPSTVSLPTHDHLKTNDNIQNAVIPANFKSSTLFNRVFSPMEQMARSDVFFATLGIHLFIKWSKTMQTRHTITMLKIPALGNSPLCPYK